MPILNYTTSIDAYKTITEIQQILAKRGARKVVMDNDKDGNPIALTFSVNWNNRDMAFSMPCNFEGVMKAMQKNKKVPRNKCNKEQALRVGWRIIKDWVEAQMAIIEAELADMAQVFLPYAVTKNGNTLYQELQTNNQILL
ncbi:hypothetical protein F0919_18010 [Taibaiella lutea]|uniref:Uncharacterized protein n=1 Tax=Taibaiella lutea TaxID=2608001 RepID=A0A5M6CC15_9BACT|nr:hypothetical protein [Taibaiella lutea]KAA5532676.1 hypothetical protein F0919_18010 [Taibaiella lutea]